MFGADYYLELQRHKATVARANHEVYKMQQVVNEKLIELSKKYDVKLVCTNDVHFVDEENAEAHDRLICLSTGKDLDDPKRMLYTKQEWMKTREEMNEIFADVPEALSNTVDICDQVEFYSIDHAPIMPTLLSLRILERKKSTASASRRKTCLMSLPVMRTEKW